MAPALFEKVEALARRNHTSEFTVMLAVLAAFLHRYADGDEVLLDSPHHNRDLPGLSDMVGFFGNCLLLKVGLQNDPTFEQILERVKRTWQEASVFSDVQMSFLVKEIFPNLWSKCQEIAPAQFNLVAIPQTRFEVGDVTFDYAIERPIVTDVTFSSASYWSDVSFTVLYANRNTMALMLVYNTLAWDGRALEGLLSAYASVMQRVVEDPGLRLSELGGKLAPTLAS